jgi:hypothetical protein
MEPPAGVHRFGIAVARREPLFKNVETSQLQRASSS